MTGAAQDALDRAILADCIHHSDDVCDRAAQRLAASKDHTSRALGQEWLQMRGNEARQAEAAE